MSTLGQMFGAREGDTFMGLPAWDGSRVPAVLLGADGCTPYPSVGSYCAGGPQAIRAAGAPFDATKHNFDLGGPAFGPVLPADAGDLPVREDDPEGNRRLIHDRITDILTAGAVPVLLGGDDSLPIPMLQALEPHGPLTILQIDAHIDWREEVEGTRWGLSSTMRRASEMPHVERIIQVGQRGIGSARPSDVQDARDWGVQFVSAYEVHRNGVLAALRHIPDGTDVVVCLDFDAFDPAIMPAVIGRTAGGLTYDHVLSMLWSLPGRTRLRAISMTEFMPGRDVDGLGAMTAAQLLCAALGLLSQP